MVSIDNVSRLKTLNKLSENYKTMLRPKKVGMRHVELISLKKFETTCKTKKKKTPIKLSIT